MCKAKVRKFFILIFPGVLELCRKTLGGGFPPPPPAGMDRVNGQPSIGKSTIMEIMKLTIKEDFRLGTVFSCFSYHKITLFENKYGIRLIILISMYHLNLL